MNLIKPFRGCLHAKFHPGMKRVQGWKNFCLHVSFIPGWNESNFIRGWNLTWKKTFHWVWKHIIKFIILAWCVKRSDDYFFRKVTLFSIFVYEIEQNRTYSTNLTTIKCGLNQKQPPEVFYKKGVPKNFAKFTGKHLYQRLFLNKVAGVELKFF